MKVTVLVSQSCPAPCIPWTVACQAPLSLEFSRQEYGSRLPFPSPKICLGGTNSKYSGFRFLFTLVHLDFDVLMILSENTVALIKANMCLVLSGVQLFAASGTVAHQAPLFMECSRPEYWSGLPLSIPGDLPNPGIEPASLGSPTLAGRFFTTTAPEKPQ